MTIALLKRGGQFMLTASPDPVALAVALSAHMQDEVELVATFPAKVCVGRPMRTWFLGDEQEVLTSLVASFYADGAVSDQAAKGTSEHGQSDLDGGSMQVEPASPGTIRSLLEVCTKLEADSASMVKATLYKQFGKRDVRALLRSELKETTVKRNGRFDKVIKDELKRCLRLRTDRCGHALARDRS